jgi:heptaprenylglyceryl phosphate synthase
LVLPIKQNSNLPIVLFPGNPSQISDEADAILFLSLISGRNPDYLIEHQVMPFHTETNRFRNYLYRIYFDRKWN